MHLLRQDLLDAAVILQMTGIDVHPAVAVIGGTKERQTVDMVPVGVAEQQVNIADSCFQHLLSQRPDPRPGVENKPPIVENDLDATGVAAVTNMLRRRACDAAANPPELDCEHRTGPVSAGERPRRLHACLLPLSHLSSLRPHCIAVALVTH